MSDIPEIGCDDFMRALDEMRAALGDTVEIKERAMEGLRVIVDAIQRHMASGQARTLVQFLAGLYNGPEYHFDLTKLRGLDVPLANACLDYLSYDRLGSTEVHLHLPNGARDLHYWIEYTGVVSTPKQRVQRRASRRGT